MKLYINNKYIVCSVLFFLCLELKASLPNNIEQKSTSIVTNSNTQTRVVAQSEENSSVNPYTCLCLCCWPCFVACPDFMTEKFIPSVEKCCSCCKSDEMK